MKYTMKIKKILLNIRNITKDILQMIFLLPVCCCLLLFLRDIDHEEYKYDETYELEKTYDIEEADPKYLPYMFKEKFDDKDENK